MEQLKFEEAEQIFGWKQMQPGTYVFVDKEVRGMNKWMKPIAVVTLKENVGAPSSATPRPHFTMGLKADQTRGGSSMKAWLNPKPATNTLSLSTFRKAPIEKSFQFNKWKRFLNLEL